MSVSSNAVAALLSVLILLTPAAAQLQPNVLLDVSGEASATVGESSQSLRVALFVLLNENGVAPGRDTLMNELQPALDESRAYFERCGIGVDLERLQVLAVPGGYLDVDGNHRGESGGHPPEDVLDLDLYTYQERLRLPQEVRELSRYAKSVSSANSVAVFVLHDIVYYIGSERVGAAGLSYPPNAYHHPDDYPYRNIVLLEGEYESFARFPGFDAAPLWHELEHMLLNSGAHDSEREARGQGADDHCPRMRANVERLYGDDALPDPGPPTTVGPDGAL